MKAPTTINKILEWVRKASNTLPFRRDASKKSKVADNWLQEDSHLLKLPNELLLQILTELSPSDIARASQSCKQIFTLSSDYRREAKELVPWYSQVSCDVGRCNFSTSSPIWRPPSFALELLRNPRIGRYVKNLKLYDVDETTDLDSGLDVVEYQAALLGALERYMHLDQKQSQVWLEQMESGHWDLSTAIMLSLLSHLQHLEIISCRLPSSSTAKCITYLVQQTAVAKVGINVAQALSKLSSVALFMPLDTTFELATSFAALPSVQRLSLWLSPIRGRPFQDWHHDPLSNITELKIFQGSFDTDDVVAFLDNLLFLRSFFYQIQWVAAGGGLSNRAFAPNRLCQALLKNGKDRLEKLYIGAQDCSSWDNSSMRLITYIGSLQSFRALKVLHLDCSFIDIQNFPDLPASLQSFVLYGIIDEFFAWKMSSQVLEYDEKVLPNLRELVVWDDEIGKKIRARCKKKRMIVIVPSTLAGCWENCTASGAQAQKACKECKRSMRKGQLPLVRDSYPFDPESNERSKRSA